MIQLAFAIALRRTVSRWGLEVVLFLGIVLAVALMSSGVVFSDLLADAALRHAMNEASPEEANFIVRVFNDLDNPSLVSRRLSTYKASLDFVDRRVEQPFRPYMSDQARLFETETFFFHGHSNLEMADEIRPRGRIQYMTGFMPDRIKIIEGIWPYSLEGSRLSPEQPMEVAIDAQGAELLELGVGDVMEVFPAAGSTNPVPMLVKFVAIFERTNPVDEFWYSSRDVFSTTDHDYLWTPLFTSEDAILDVLGLNYPGLYTNITWFFYTDRHGIRASDVANLQNNIRRVEFDLRTSLDHSSSTIKLDSVLGDYDEQLILARIPLFLMVFLVTGILIYYLALVAGLVTRSRTTEISMLKSRGATTGQIGLLAMFEGLLLAVPAIILGPILAIGVSRVLGRIFFDVGGALGHVPITFSSQAFLLGVAGALIAVVVLTLSTLSAARHGIVEFRQAGARPPGVPFIHRYYLDILLLVLIGFIWWQIQTKGSFLVRSLGTGEIEIDYSLLLGPLLGLLALGLLVLRIFPIAVTLVAKIAEPVVPAWLVQGLRRVARDPVIPGTLVVLLMLATAMGVIGSAFSSTLERSQRDRALYAAGADLRIEHGGSNTGEAQLNFSDLAIKLEGVTEAVDVQRTGGYLGTSGFSDTRVSVLAVDTEKFARVVWHRSDFAGGKSPEQLIAAITPDPSSIRFLNDGIELPGDATALALWVHPARPESNSSIRARFRDARGFFFDMSVGQLDFRGWRRFEADISPVPPRGRTFQRRFQLPVVTPPFTLLSLHIPSRFGAREPGALFLGTLSAVTPTGETMIADFQTTDGWSVVEDYAKTDLYALESSSSVTRDGMDSSTRFSWAPGGFGLRGIRVGGLETPMAALVSKSLLDNAEAKLGDTLSLTMSTTAIPFQPVEVADYFPTLDPRKEPFVVVDLKTFNHYLNMHDQTLNRGSNELWSSLNGGGGGTGEVIDALSGGGVRVGQIFIASEMVNERVEQPLVNAGWGGLLVLMFLSLVLASASGVMLYSYLDTRERYTEFAILRTLGFSKRQLNSVAWFNLFVVVACGLGIGTWVGQWIGASLVPLLEVAEQGVRVTPPMVLQTNWTTLLVSYLVLAGVTITTVVWLAWLNSKLDLQKVLRIGDA